MARYKTFVNAGSLLPADLNAIQDYIDSQDAAILAASQPLDSDLTAIAALTTTATGRSLLAAASAAALRAIIDSPRVIAGHVSGTTVISGSGFTVTNPGAGLYTITFTTPFASTPSLTVTAFAGTMNKLRTANIGVGSGSTSAFDVQIKNETATLANEDFCFIAAL